MPTHSTAEDRRSECSGVLQASPVDVYKEVLGSFLMQFQWDSFFTGTFRQPMSGAGTMVLFERWLKRVAWRISVGKAPGTPFRWATKPYAAIFHEVGCTTGRDHVHALVGNVKPLPVYCGKLLPPGWFGHFSCCLMHYWPHGIARAVEYDVCKGATHYLTKYTTKALGEWRVVGCPKKNVDNGAPGRAPSSSEVL